MSTKDNSLATILVAKEKISNMIMATVVPLKGGSVDFRDKRCLGFLKESGLESADEVLKSGQEIPIMDLLEILANEGQQYRRWSRMGTSASILQFPGDRF